MYAIYNENEIHDMMCEVFNEPLKNRIIVQLNTKITDLDYYMFDRSDGEGNIFTGGVRITANYEPLLFLENIDFEKAVDYIFTLVKMKIVKRVYTENY